MPRVVWVLTVVMACGCSRIAPDRPAGAHLFLWAGDAERKASDFLGVIDADPDSAHYGAIVASLPTGMAGTHPHHTEHEMPAGNQLLANGFHAGRTWLFDLTLPLRPRVVTTFGDVAGFSHPHDRGAPIASGWASVYHPHVQLRPVFTARGGPG